MGAKIGLIKLNKLNKMIEGRPRDSLVLYETPIEVRILSLSKSHSFVSFDVSDFFFYLRRQHQELTPTMSSKRHLDVSFTLF